MVSSLVTSFNSVATQCFVSLCVFVCFSCLSRLHTPSEHRCRPLVFPLTLTTLSIPCNEVLARKRNKCSKGRQGMESGDLQRERPLITIQGSPRIDNHNYQITTTKMVNRKMQFSIPIPKQAKKQNNNKKNLTSSMFSFSD